MLDTWIAVWRVGNKTWKLYVIKWVIQKSLAYACGMAV